MFVFVVMRQNSTESSVDSVYTNAEQAELRLEELLDDNYVSWVVKKSLVT